MTRLAITPIRSPIHALLISILIFMVDVMSVEISIIAGKKSAWE